MKHIKLFEIFFQGSGYGDGTPIYSTFGDSGVNVNDINKQSNIWRDDEPVHIDFLNNLIDKLTELKGKDSMSKEDRAFVEKLYSLHKNDI
jgi:hypothetical protein